MCITSIVLKIRNIAKIDGDEKYLCYKPVTGTGHHKAQQIVDDVCEDDGGDGATRDREAGILQVTWWIVHV